MNTEILGCSMMHQGNDGQWTFPIDDEQQKLKEVNLTNPIAQKIVTKFECLFPACLACYIPEVQQKWEEMMIDHRLLHKLLSSHFEFRFRDVCEYQKVADKCMDKYGELTGRDCMTNYFALHRHGHWASFLLQFGNGYKYSQ